MGTFKTRWPPRQTDRSPVIDMTPDGRFTSAAPARSVPLLTQITIVAVLVSIVASAVALAALALWLALALLPVVIGATAVAYVGLRLQAWRRGRLFGGKRDLFRP